MVRDCSMVIMIIVIVCNELIVATSAAIHRQINKLVKICCPSK